MAFVPLRGIESGDRFNTTYNWSWIREPFLSRNRPQVCRRYIQSGMPRRLHNSMDRHEVGLAIRTCVDPLDWGRRPCMLLIQMLKILMTQAVTCHPKPIFRHPMFLHDLVVAVLPLRQRKEFRDRRAGVSI